jgi:hypothetical protein
MMNPFRFERATAVSKRLSKRARQVSRPGRNSVRTAIRESRKCVLQGAPNSLPLLRAGPLHQKWQPGENPKTLIEQLRYHSGARLGKQIRLEALRIAPQPNLIFLDRRPS